MPVIVGAAGVLATITLLGSCSKGSKADTKPPQVPTGLLVTRGDERVQLTWDAVTANDLEGYYPYHWEGTTGTPVKGALVSTTQAWVPGLTNGTEYSFHVTSVDEAGNESAPSAQVSATPNNEVDLTQQGWTAWEAGNYGTAGPLFEDALTFDVTYADAHNGRGWTALRQGDLTEAEQRFGSANNYNLTAQDARVGLLAVYRDAPGKLTLAMANGIAILQNDPSYVFSHDTTVDADMVRVMLSQVYFRLGEDYFDEAQLLMDAVVPGNGLDPASSGTWTVDSTSYSTYAAALLALIQSAFDLL
jgi:hypothetical protein